MRIEGVRSGEANSLTLACGLMGDVVRSVRRRLDLLAHRSAHQTKRSARSRRLRLSAPRADLRPPHRHRQR